MSVVPDEVLDTVTERLADAGLSPEFIANAVDAPISRVRAILSVRRGTRQITDEKLNEEVTSLAHMAVKEARLILEFGPSEQKLAIVKSFLGGLTRQATQGQSSEAQEMRIALDAVFNSMREVPTLDKVVTENDFIDVAVIGDE